MIFSSDNFHSIAVFEGILIGISADSEINMAEIGILRKWLEDNRHLSELLPFEEFYTTVEKIHTSGEMSAEEHDFLLASCNEFKSAQAAWETVQHKVLDSLHRVFNNLWYEFSEHVREDLFISKALFHLHIPLREFSSLFMVASRALEAFCIETLVQLQLIDIGTRVQFNKKFRFENQKTIEEMADPALRVLFLEKMGKAMAKYRHPFVHVDNATSRIKDKKEAEEKLNGLLTTIVGIDVAAKTYANKSKA